MDNYEVLEVIHASRTSETIILKVKEKNKRIKFKCCAVPAVVLWRQLFMHSTDREKTFDRTPALCYNSML